MSTPAVTCTNLEKKFGQVEVIRQVSFTVAQGEILALLGPSGCGKTTVLRLIAGFEEADAGQIAVGDAVVVDPPFHMPPERRRVGMVFQDYAIFPHLSVAQNVAFGLPRSARGSGRVADLLKLVGLGGRGDDMPHELSGGQQQRVALARALAPEPAVLLFDEPFSNLDAGLRTQVRQEVRSLLKKNGTTAIFVTHDQEEALFLGDRVALMHAGRIAQIGPPEALFEHPATRFVAEFLGMTTFIPGESTDAGIRTALGLLPYVPEPPTAEPLSVAVRPADVAMRRTTTEPNAEVVARQFGTVATLYALRLEDGAIVHSLQPHALEYALGDAVHASVRPGHVLPCFAADAAVTLRQVAPAAA